MMVTNKNIFGKRDGWKEELRSRESRSFLAKKRVHRIVDLCKLFFLKKINQGKKNKN